MEASITSVPDRWRTPERISHALQIMTSTATQVPHFTVPTLDGRTLAYTDLWQRRSLLLVCLPGGVSADEPQYTAQLAARAEEIQALETTAVVTRTPVAGLPCPGVTIADRWGEVVHTASAQQMADMPPVDDLLEWLRYVQYRCPECEGEAK